IGEDVDLSVQPAFGLWPMKVDPGQMEQVVMNLVINSRDAMPGGGQLTIETANVELDESYASTHPQARPGAYVRLAVTDSGCGMDAATRARIFEPFFTTKGVEHGTGLGLATVYGIVTQSGGHIEVYSEQGSGSTFKIYIPRTSDAATGAAKERPPRGAAAQGTETVLLVEDEEGVRILARKALEKYGYTVIEAPHPDAALRLVAEATGPIHILVTDVVMPNMSGRQLAERLQPERPDMRVLYISGYTDDAVVRHGILEATMPFLSKPFTPDALVRKIRNVLDAG
ncbi:MAG TPA: ATP-binding protein, partial [Planctomycetaceae bacterium]